MSLLEKLKGGITTGSAAETQAIARTLAGALAPDTTLALHGDLGVGKTTFVQGLAQGLGVTEAVTSPTFNIYSLHRGPKWTLVHLDAYRLKDAQQVEDLLLEDFLISPWCLAIEWPEIIADWIPKRALHLRLGISLDERHSLQLTSGPIAAT